MSIGKRIKERRKELRMSADELGRILGKDRSTVFRYENGYIEKLPIDILHPIAEALKTTPEYLMGWEEIEKNNDTIADAVVRMRSDDEFLETVKVLLTLDKDAISSVKQLILTLHK